MTGQHLIIIKTLHN